MTKNNKMKKYMANKTLELWSIVQPVIYYYKKSQKMLKKEN